MKDTTLVEKLVKAKSEGKEETLQRLAGEINECFGKSFLPEGFIKARITDYGTLWLDIGDRNGEFDTLGKRVGSGSKINNAVKWDIQEIVWSMDLAEGKAIWGIDDQPW